MNPRKRKPRKRLTESRARKTSSVPTLVFEIGGGNWRHLPLEVRRSIQDEIFAGHLHRVRLIQIENTRRARKHEIRMGLSPQLEALNASYDDLETQLGALRSMLKSKAERTTPAQLDLLRQINVLKAEKKVVLAEMYGAKSALDEQHDWRPFDEEWKKAKETRLAAAADARGKKSLGPNDRERHRIVAELYEEFVGSDRPPEWRAWHAARRDAEIAVKEARNIASQNPPPGIVPLSPGTYQAVEAAVKQAAKDTIGPLKIPRFDGCGRVGIQLTDGKGATVSAIMGGQCERFSIEVLEDVRLRKGKSDEFHPSHSRPVDLHAEQRQKRAELYARDPQSRPYRKAAKVRIKVRGHVKDAVYLELQGILHRRLPEDAIVKWVYVDIDRVGYDLHYRVLLTLESRLASPERVRPGNEKHLAVNFGWRVEGHQIRIATTWDGVEHRHIYLDSDTPDAMRKGSLTMRAKHRHVRNLLGHADEKFDRVIVAVREWLSNLSPTEAERLTPHLVRALARHTQQEGMTIGNITSLMSKWRDHRKLVRIVSALRSHAGYLDDETLGHLWQTWRRERLTSLRKLDLFPERFAELREWMTLQGVPSLDGAVVFYGFLWHRKETHLTNVARNQETRLGRRRLDRYRKLAFAWARDYDKIVIEKWDKSQTAQTPKYEEDWRCPQEEQANAVRQFVGVSVLTATIRRKFGGDCLEENALDITSEHFGCGGHAIPEIDPDKPGLSLDPDLECDKCHRRYDQDRNATLHLWARAYGEGSDDSGPRGGEPRTSPGGERSGAPSLAGGARDRATQQKDSTSFEDAAE